MRGKPASREKLLTALIDAGLKTQAALAERIAELEGLESPPTTSISQAFSGRSVDDTTIERIARALNVRSSDLYEDTPSSVVSSQSVKSANSSDDASLEIGKQDTENLEFGVSSRPVEHDLDRVPVWNKETASVILLLIGLAFVAAVWQISRDSAPQDDIPIHQAIVTTEPSISRPTLAFATPEGMVADRATDKLQQALTKYWPLLPNKNRYESGNPPAGIDVLLELSTIGEGRHLVLNIYASDQRSRLLIWSDTLPRIAAEAYIAERMAIAADKIDEFYTREEVPKFPSLAAQENYLKGKDFLDLSRREINVRRAQAAFESALRQSPEWADAQAGLCVALIQEHIWSTDTRKLEDAKLACQAAQAIDPNNIEVMNAVGFLARKSSDYENAEATLRAVLARDANNIDALLHLSEVHLQAFMTGKDTEGATQAIEVIERAMGLAPYFWKAPFTRARIGLISGDIDTAITMNKLAAKLNDNFVSQSNLGTTYMCSGEFRLAKDAYLAAYNHAPEFPISEEHVGIGYYFLGDYEQATQYFAKAIEKQSSDGSAEHRIWGNYADSLRNAGRVNEAIDAYDKALLLVESTIVKGDSKPTHTAHRAYYLAALAKLSAKRDDAMTRQAVGQALAELEEAANDPESFVKIAGARLLRGEVELARQSYVKVKGICAGYAKMPEMRVLED